MATTSPNNDDGSDLEGRGDSVDHQGDRGDSPTDVGDRQAGTVETRSVSWTVPTDAPLHRHRKTALFFEAGDGWRLEHVREVILRQKGATESTLDGDVSVSDLPAFVLRDAGLSGHDLASDRDGRRRQVATAGGGPA